MFCSTYMILYQSRKVDLFLSLSFSLLSVSVLTDTLNLTGVFKYLRVLP